MFVQSVKWRRVLSFIDWSKKTADRVLYHQKMWNPDGKYPPVQSQFVSTDLQKWTMLYNYTQQIQFLTIVGDLRQTLPEYNEETLKLYYFLIPSHLFWLQKYESGLKSFRPQHEDSGTRK